MVSLAFPAVLALLPLPWILTRLLPAARGREPALIGPEATVSWFSGRARAAAAPPGERWRRLTPWIVWILLILAMSGPRQIVPTPALPVTGRDVMIALDLSGSMVRTDFALDGAEISRLDAVKKVGGQFVRGRGGDRVGVVIFGAKAYVAAPLSYDVENVARTIEEAVIGISGRSTNMGDGLGLALKRLNASDAASKVVILLSDGRNNAGAARPRDVAKLTGASQVRVHTIALGPKDETTAEEGERGVVDAATLRAIAEVSGGAYFRVKTLSDLTAVAEDIDRLESIERAGVPAEIYRALWLFPAAAALCLLAMTPVIGRSA